MADRAARARRDPLQLIIGVPLGVLAAMRRNRWQDHAANLVGLLGQSCADVRRRHARSCTSSRIGSVGFRSAATARDCGRGCTTSCLPALTLAAVGIAYYARVVRSEMIDVLGEDYIRTARAKGVAERDVIVKHALRNALGPLVTLIGLDLGVLLGGAVVTEFIFAWPGLGRELLQATSKSTFL